METIDITGLITESVSLTLKKPILSMKLSILMTL